MSTLVASGLVRRRQQWPWWLATAAALVISLGFAMYRLTHRSAYGKTYAVLMYEDSTYVPAPPGHDGERVAVIAHWADSLDKVGKFDLAGRLLGPGPLGGMVVIRAADDAEAAQIAATCPFPQWGGHIEVKRFEP